MCPICLLQNRVTRSFIGLGALIIIIIFDILLPIGAYELFIRSGYSSFLLVLVIIIVFWISTVLLIITSFYEYKRILQLEKNLYLFIESVNIFQDENLNKYKQELEIKYKKHDY